MAEEKLELNNMESDLLSNPKGKAKENLNSYERVFQPCIAEIIGTMFFVFIGCVSVIENVEATGRLQPALVHGLAVAVLVACMAEISGAHFNPPFTIAIYICGGIQLKKALSYLVCQLIGGVLGAGLAKVMTIKENYANAEGAAFTIVKSDDQLMRALFAEMAMTCLITTVVLLAALNAKTKSPLAPFLIGCTVIINVLAGGDISGTCLNPARALGPAVMTGYWTYHWIYWVGPITGGIVAAALVRVLLGDRKTRVLMK
ncbi:aquaporin-8b [Chanos chanos]|uniref:Aquaporin-8b n=1 Tax=Chanos chanos TaxID=29144 RepID=A0A6J2WPR2_CHACN|nr:aquaporin-8-like [Chanos chanos]